MSPGYFGLRRRTLLLACLPLMVFPLTVHADYTEWTNGAGDDLWDNSLNWNPAVPMDSSSVGIPAFPQTASYNIDLGGSTRTVNDLTFQAGGNSGYSVNNGTLSANQITNYSGYFTPQTISADLTSPTNYLAIDAQEDGVLDLSGMVNVSTVVVGNYFSNTPSVATVTFDNPSNTMSLLTVGSDHYFGASVNATTPGALGTATLVANEGANITFSGVDPGGTSSYPNSIAVSNAVNIRAAVNDASPNAVIALNTLQFPSADTSAYFESNSNTGLAFSNTVINGYTSLQSFTYERGTRASLDLGSVSESSPLSSLSAFGSGVVTVSGSSTYTGNTYSYDGMLLAAQADSFGTNPASVVYATHYGAIEFLSAQAPFHSVYVDPHSGLGGDLTGAVYSGPGQNVFLSEASILFASSTNLPVRGVDVDHPAYLLGIQTKDLTATVGEDPDHTSLYKGIALGAYTPNAAYGEYIGTVSTYSGTDPIEVFLNDGFWVLNNVQFDTADTATGVHFQGIGEGRIGAAHGTATVFTATGSELSDTSNNYIMSLADHNTLAPGESVHISNGDLFTGYMDSVSTGATVNIHDTGTYVIGAYNEIADGSPTSGTFNIDAGGAVYLTNPSFNLTSGATFNFAPGSLLIFDVINDTVDNSAPGSIPTAADVILKTSGATIAFTDAVILGDGRRITTPADSYAIVEAPALTAAPGATGIRLSAAADQFLDINAPVQLTGVDLIIGDDEASNHSFTTLTNFTERAATEQSGQVILDGDATTRDLTVLSGNFTATSELSVRNFIHASDGASTLNASEINLAGDLSQSAGYVFINAPINYGHGASITLTGGYTNFAAIGPSTLTDARHEMTIGSAATAYLDGPGDPFSDSAGHLFDIQNDGSFVVYGGVYKMGAVSGSGIFTLYGPTLTVDSIRQTYLDIESGTVKVRPSGGANSSISRAAFLILGTSNSATLDLTDNKLVVDYETGFAPIDTIRGYLFSGRNGGSWNGAGLISSTAANDMQNRLAIGYAEASVLGINFWGDQSIDNTSLVMKLTWYGDANLDGKINGDDYAILDRSLARNLANPHWTDGDFNYDGVINSADYFLIDRVFGQQNGVLSPALLAMREAEFGKGYVSELIAAVPEPGMGLACLLAVWPMLARRRSNRSLAR